MFNRIQYVPEIEGETKANRTFNNESLIMKSALKKNKYKTKTQYLDINDAMAKG